MSDENSGQPAGNRGKTLKTQRFSVLSLLAGLAWAWPCVAADPASVAPPEAEPNELREALEQGRFADAESRARSLLDEIAADAEPAVTARLLDALVESLWRGGKAADPETPELARRAVRTNEAAFGPRSRELADSLDNLGQVLRLAHARPESLEAFERALAIREALFGPDHAEVAASLNRVAWMLYETDQLDRARATYERAIRIRETLLGESHPQVAALLNNLAIVLRNAGVYDEAERLYRRTVDIYEATVGPDDPLLAAALNNLAVLLKARGDLAAARPLYERYLRITEQRSGPDHPRVATGLNNLAALLRELGDFDTARELHERALRILERSAGADPRALAATLNNLGNLLGDLGQVPRAQELLERALALRRDLLGGEHRLVAQSLNNLGNLLASSDRPLEALPLLEEALAIRERELGADHPDVAAVLENLSRVRRDTGEPERALADIERARSIYERSVGANDLATARALLQAAALRLDLGDGARSLDGALRAEEIGREHLRNTARALSEREALAYASVRPEGLDLALSALVDGSVDDDGARVRTWEALIRSRALVLDELKLRRFEGPEAEPLVESLAAASRREANLVVRGPGDTAIEEYRSLLDAARRERELADRALARASMAFRRQRDEARIGWAEVAAALAPDTALVAFVQYGHSRPLARTDAASPGDRVAAKPVRSYAVWIQRPGAPAPGLIGLGPAATIDELILAWRAAIAEGRGGLPAARAQREWRYRSAGALLRQRIWEPLAPWLEGLRTVFLVPDGLLHLVSFDTLPLGDDGYLVEHAPVFAELAAERDFARKAGPPPGAGGLLVVGSPDFDAAAEGSAPVAATRPAPPDACAHVRELRFTPLPASRLEAEEVAARWPEGEGGVTLLQGAGASESAFKSGAPGRRALHLATHGFFVEGCPSPASREGILPFEAPGPPVVSGLALAGANRPLAAARPDAEDGVLTAEEIAALDLRGVEWVVLSGCDTGVGQPLAGEGVLGLQRSFRIAGAEALVMSLWPVEDATVRSWVRRLYEGRRAGASPAEAVHRANLETLTARREHGQDTHPYHWGAFVSSGGGGSRDQSPRVARP